MNFPPPIRGQYRAKRSSFVIFFLPTDPFVEVKQIFQLISSISFFDDECRTFNNIQVEF